MAFVSSRHDQHMGKVIGTGHCVPFVREVTGAPITTQWRRGAKVRDNPDLAIGTAIATFDPNGLYGNHVDGRSHAAVLIAVRDNGLLVVDQWVGQSVHQRVIRFRDGSGDAVNDGDQYHVIEAA
jgi:hypothetical protein